jgi:2-polyprenyl-3-methyl-5-hydroxy-6-metoxy-1,4-benzoquinol methylase
VINTNYSEVPKGILQYQWGPTPRLSDPLAYGNKNRDKEMQRNETTKLPSVPTYVRNIWQLLAPLAKGKAVLNIGAAGNVEYYLDGHRDLWMHDKLKPLARELVGLDIDRESVAYANARGESLLLGNCEDVELAREFDLIVLSEVIEHVYSPTAALANLARHLAPGGKLFITTPNPTYYGTVLRAFFNRSLHIYYDHITAYFPENLVVLSRRLGLKVTGIHFYNVTDVRSANLKFRSWMARQIGQLIHRYSSNFILIIEN